MLVKILKGCYCIHAQRFVQPGELIPCKTLPTKAIEDGLVELVSDVPDSDKVKDIGYRDRPVRYQPSTETR
jgi:hypothetical protein